LTRFEVRGVIGTNSVKMEIFRLLHEAKRKIPDFATAMTVQKLPLEKCSKSAMIVYERF